MKKKLIGLYNEIRGWDWAMWFWVIVIAGLWVIAFTALIKSIAEDLNPNSSPPPIEQSF